MSGVNNGPLHVGLDLPTNPASVYSYGAAGKFPTSTFGSTNYWVDVVFSATATVTPRVSSVSPLPGASGIATNTAITATFNESIQMGSLSFVLTDSNGNTVPATVSYVDSTHTAILIPNAALNYPATYTATISGATGQNGVMMPSPVSWSFTTSYQVGTAYSFWNNATKPTIASATDNSPVEVGVQFESSIAGTISGIRFYDGNSAGLAASGNTGITYVAHLWTSTGSLLATANYTLNDDSSLGWQQVNFTHSVPIAANTVYVASYYAPKGGYAMDIGYFANSGVTSGPLNALSTTQGKFLRARRQWCLCRRRRRRLPVQFLRRHKLLGRRRLQRQHRQCSAAHGHVSDSRPGRHERLHQHVAVRNIQRAGSAR